MSLDKLLKDDEKKPITTEAESFFPPKKEEQPKEEMEMVFEVEDDPKPSNKKVKTSVDTTYEMIVPTNNEEMKFLPSKQIVKSYFDMYNYVKQTVVNASDYQSIKGKKFLKKSGWRKFINAFKISIEPVKQETFDRKLDGKMDTHCRITVKATMPNGQYCYGQGIKSLSELYDKTLHNLEANAWTRAVNRAVSDLIGFGEVSLEEMADDNDVNEDDPFSSL